MAESAASRAGRLGRVRAVGSIGHVFPFTIAEFLVIRAEAPLLPHDEYCGESVGYEAPFAIEERLSGRVLLHGIAFKENDRAIRKIEHVSRTDRGGDGVDIYGPDLLV